MRALTRWTLAFATLLPACDPGDGETNVPGATQPLACRSRVDAEELLPSDAVAIGYYDMDRERRFAPDISKSAATGARALLPSVEIEAARLAWVGLAAACELDDGFLGEAWVAVDREEEVLTVLEGKGIGDPDKLRCIQRRLSKWEEDLGAVDVLTNDGCGVQFQYDGTYGFAPNDDLFVLGTLGAVDRARKVWNSGSGNPPRELMPDRRKSYVWAAVDVPALIAPDTLESALRSSGQPEATAFINVRTVNVDAQLTRRRYQVGVGASFGAEEDANAAQAVLQAFLDAPPPSLPAWSKTVISRMSVTRDGLSVSLSLPLSRRDAHELALLPTKTEANQAPALPVLLFAVAFSH